MGKLDKRPVLETIRPELSRGMKVRSSVKKLCEGCKVGLLIGMPFVVGDKWIHSFRVELIEMLLPIRVSDGKVTSI